MVFLQNLELVGRNVGKGKITVLANIKQRGNWIWTMRLINYIINSKEWANEMNNTIPTLLLTLAPHWSPLMTHLNYCS